MSISDELRRDADAALREDGMYYSGEYLDGIAKRVEEVGAENVKLRELCGEMLLYIVYPYVCVKPSVLVERAHELGIEVSE